MRKLVLFLSLFFLAFTLPAQEVSDNLESYQVTTIGDSIILSGFKPLSKGSDFIATLYDKKLTLIKHYEKKLPDGAASYYTGRSGNLTVFIFYGERNNEKFRIVLDNGFNEKYAAAPEKGQKADKSIYEAGDWEYAPDYNNEYIYGNLLIDTQLDGITCYALDDAIKCTYKMKWEKDYNEREFQRMNLLGIHNNVAYYFAVELYPDQFEKIIAIDLSNGAALFSTELDESDTIDALSVSSLYYTDNTIYLAGTDIIHEGKVPFRPYIMPSDKTKERGYDNPCPYIMSPADGYFIMTLDSKTGKITGMKTQDFPLIDKTTDHRIYHMAVCPGISQLNNGKMIAFFQQMSTPYQPGPNTSMKGTELFTPGGSDQFDPRQIIWDIDGFTSVVFTPDLKDVDYTTFKWEEDVSTYDLSDFDLFSLNPYADVPPGFCTMGEAGTYPQYFRCDGNNWTYHLHTDNPAPDYLVQGKIQNDEVKMSSLKLLPPGLLMLQDAKTGLQLKDGGKTIQLKLVTY